MNAAVLSSEATLVVALSFKASGVYNAEWSNFKFLHEKVEQLQFRSIFYFDIFTC